MGTGTGPKSDRFPALPAGTTAVGSGTGTVWALESLLIAAAVAVLRYAVGGWSTAVIPSVVSAASTVVLPAHVERLPGERSLR